MATRAEGGDDEEMQEENLGAAKAWKMGARRRGLELQGRRPPRVDGEETTGSMERWAHPRLMGTVWCTISMQNLFRYSRVKTLGGNKHHVLINTSRSIS